MSKFGQAQYFYQQETNLSTSTLLQIQENDNFYQSVQSLSKPYIINGTNNKKASTAFSSELIFDAPYLLLFHVGKNSVGTFNVQLTMPTDSALSPQTFYSFTKKYKTSQDNVCVSTVFVPYSNFQRLTWTKTPAFTFNPSRSTEQMDIGNVRLYKLKKLSGLPNNITKIGIQANPFTYFLINKEPIRVGRNGIYEVDGINISSIYAAPLSTGSFIIDYKYD